MKLGWTRVRLSPGPLCRKAERPVEGANDASLYAVLLQAFLFFVAIAKSGKAEDCKSFILGSNPSGDFVGGWLSG